LLLVAQARFSSAMHWMSRAKVILVRPQMAAVRSAGNSWRAHRRQHAYPFYSEFALLPIYLPELLVAPRRKSLRFRRSSSTRCKAPLKKSISNTSRVTSRFNPSGFPALPPLA